MARFLLLFKAKYSILLSAGDAFRNIFAASKAFLVGGSVADRQALRRLCGQSILIFGLGSSFSFLAVIEMANETNNKGDVFNDVLAPIPDTSNRVVQRVDAEATLARYEAVRRDLWATAAFAALAYWAVGAMAFVGLRDLWNDFSPSLRAGVLIAWLALTYGVAFLGGRFENPPLCKLFCIFGTLIYGAALALLSCNAPDTFTLAGLEQLGGAFVAIAPLWALGAFVLAAVYQARTLHYCAALIILFWLTVDRTGIDAVVALIFCAIGEYWAWKYNRASVASVYFILTVWIVVSERAIWTHKETWVLVAVALSILFYWFGANFNNALIRGFAIVAAACSLGIASFPVYWGYVVPDEIQGQFGPFMSTQVPAILSAIFFILFCVNITLGGIQRSTVRFIFGVFITAVWTAGQAFNASLAFGTLGTALVLGGVGILFVAIILLERVCRKRLDWEQDRERFQRKRDKTIPTDDPEFDNIVEREARRLQEAGPVLALQVYYERASDAIARAARQPLIGGAVALQFALLLLNTVMQWR